MWTEYASFIKQQENTVNASVEGDCGFHFASWAWSGSQRPASSPRMRWWSWRSAAWWSWPAWWRWRADTPRPAPAESYSSDPKHTHTSVIGQRIRGETRTESSAHSPPSACAASRRWRCRCSRSTPPERPWRRDWERLWERRCGTSLHACDWPSYAWFAPPPDPSVMAWRNTLLLSLASRPCLVPTRAINWCIAILS